VTYGTATDLFFSGHTAIAVFGSELARMGDRFFRSSGRHRGGGATAVAGARAHYTMTLHGDRDGALAVSVADLGSGVDLALTACRRPLIERATSDLGGT